MSHDFCRDHLGQYLDQSLDAIEREKVESHLQECPECAQIARETAGIRAAMRDMTPFPAPPELRPNVRAALQREALQREALQRQAFETRKSASRPLFGLRLPQLAWSGTLALGALTLLVLARPFAHQPLTFVEPKPASSSAPDVAASSAPPNRTTAPNSVEPQSPAKPSPAAKSSSAVQPRGGSADHSSNLNQTRGDAPSPPTATRNEPPQILIPPAPTQKGKSETLPSAPFHQRASAAPHPPLAASPLRAREAMRTEPAQAPRPAKVAPQLNTAAPIPPHANSQASAPTATALPPNLNSAAPAMAPEKPQADAPRMSRSRPAAKQQTTPALTQSAGAVQPLLRRKAAGAARVELPAPLFSFQLRTAPAPARAAPSADAMSDAAAPNPAPVAPVPSLAPAPAASGATPPLAVAGAAASGAAASQVAPGAAPEHDRADRGAASPLGANALANAGGRGGFARSTRARGLSPASNAPKMAEGEARDAAVAREASNGSTTRRFSLQIRAAYARKNARIRIEVAAPARVLWPRSGAVWSGDLAAGTPVEIGFSLGGVRGGEKITIVLEQKVAGAPSRPIETQTLTVPPAP